MVPPPPPGYAPTPAQIAALQGQPVKKREKKKPLQKWKNLIYLYFARLIWDPTGCFFYLLSYNSFNLEKNFVRFFVFHQYSIAILCLQYFVVIITWIINERRHIYTKITHLPNSYDIDIKYKITHKLAIFIFVLENKPFFVG